MIVFNSSEETLSPLITKLDYLNYQPLFSIIFPVFNTPEKYLTDAIESVLHQIYPYWELCIADDASTEPHIRKIVEHYSQRDSRIKVVFRTENGHISRSSNSAIEIADGEFIALLDHDDLLTPDALYEAALLLNQHPEADMIYSDEDKVDDNNQFIIPTHKSDWCPDSFLSRMYTCHLGIYRSSIINEIGGLRVGYEGSQDYDLVLRFTEKTEKIFHIPKVLYHWRLHPGSTSASTTAKPYAYKAGLNALRDALQRRGEKGEILPDAMVPGHYHARYQIEDYELVSIIIIARDVNAKLNQCLESIFAKTAYPNYEVSVLIVGNSTSERELILRKWQIQQPHKFKYYYHENCLNESKLNNFATTQAQGDYLLFLSSDIQITQENWLNAMVEQAQREPIGAVGVCLLNSNNSIQHVGLTLGLGKIADSMYKGLTKIDKYEVLANIELIKNVSAITGDCLMCRRDVFESVGGFDESLPIIYNDVDLCLKMVRGGYRNIYIPHVKLIYQELRNWQVDISNQESLQLEDVAVNFMRQKWGEILEYDPCVSPHTIKNLNSDIQIHGYFQTVGESEKYYEYIEKNLDDLHQQIFNNNIDAAQKHQIINAFIQNNNFIPPYFNERNLKNIYVKRAEIIEHFLKLKGLETDYQFTDRPVNRKKIRLGILATDFTPSAETFAYLPVYEYLSRNFEVILYPLAETGEPLEQYCQLSANLFKPLPQELSQQVKTIRDDDLDILFIATNVTISTNQFCLLAAHRLARIQVTSGGSVVTTGMRNMDYYISGTLTDPSPTAQEQYQEKLIKLEGSAHCFSYGTEEGKITTPVERNDLGIPEDAVVFTSCANYFKIIPELIETWAKIINQVPNSVLVLFPFGPNWARNYPKTQFINHLNSIFINYGLAPERLIVLDPQPVPDRQDMKEYYKIADVYLDSFPFAGTTSLVEPLEVNLPVIARQGNCFRSAMGAAMILTLNIPDLVADSEESYIKLAVILGNHPELRQQKSDEIKAVMNNNPGFLDSRSYSAKMGNLFQELFRNYLAENLAENLHLRQLNFIIFPDWTQSEDELGFELQQVIQTLANNPNNQNITLIIYTGNIANEDAEMFLSSVAMNLLMEDLDISDTIDISLLGMLGDMQWQSLLPRIYGRIILDNEDKVALAQGQVNKLDCYPLDSLINQI